MRILGSCLEYKSAIMCEKFILGLDFSDLAGVLLSDPATNLGLAPRRPDLARTHDFDEVKSLNQTARSIDRNKGNIATQFIG